MRKKPEMIGAQPARKTKRNSRRGTQRESLQQFNDAFDTWAKRHGRTHLGYQVATFAR